MAKVSVVRHDDSVYVMGYHCETRKSMKKRRNKRKMSTESKYIMCRPYFSLKCEKIRSMPFKQGGHGVGDNGEGLAKGRLYPTKVLLNHVKNFLGGFYKDDGMADNKEMEASMSMADIGVAVIVGKVVTKVSILAFGSRNFSIRYGVMACI